jgi:hypothetical protein
MKREAALFVKKMSSRFVELQPHGLVDSRHHSAFSSRPDNCITNSDIDDVVGALWLDQMNRSRNVVPSFIPLDQHSLGPYAQRNIVSLS